MLEAMGRALERARPDIVNSDQGSQFTSPSYISLLQAAGVRISMDDKGRATDNIFAERLWRSLKYEEVYLHEYEAYFGRELEIHSTLRCGCGVVRCGS